MVAGRFEKVEGTDIELPAQLVLLAMGFVGPEKGTWLDQLGVTLDERGNVARDEDFMTGVPGVFAAGDIARWPDPHSGENIRVEHWVVAERQGQTAARNMLGYGERFDAVPFFWSQHYDVSLNYVGYAPRYDEAVVEGSLEKHDASIRYLSGGKLLALASLFRDRASLETELAMEEAAAPQ
jgi:NADPH-dependent 2,4-dienoyl-CoA reductase/sulfur reductase-like enzyme